MCDPPQNEQWKGFVLQASWSKMRKHNTMRALAFMHCGTRQPLWELEGEHERKLHDHERHQIVNFTVRNDCVKSAWTWLWIRHWHHSIEDSIRCRTWLLRGLHVGACPLWKKNSSPR